MLSGFAIEKLVAVIAFAFFLICIPLPGMAQNLELEAARKAYANGAYDYALKVFRRGSETEMKEAQFWLGLLYDRGHGVERNQKIALQWFKKAAEQGHAEAQRVIGVYLEEGIVIDRDLTKAADWYNRAAAQNNAKAQRNLAQLYVLGRGVARDYAKAGASCNQRRN